MKRGYIILLLVVLLIIAGCTGGTNKIEKPRAFIGGNDALSIKFVDDQPPKKVLDNNQEPFEITLLIKNNGEHDIIDSDIIATLSGISQQDFQMNALSVTNNFDFPGRDIIGETETEGAEDVFEFGTATYKHNLNADFTTTVRADVCYKYRTIAAANLCLKKDTSKTEKSDVCDITNDKVVVENSGSPVHVTKIQERRSGSNQVRITFDVENIGTGDVYEPNFFTNKCYVDEDRDDRLSIDVTSPSSDITARCAQLDGAHSGNVRLTGGKKLITCTIDTLNIQETAFEGRVNIFLDYFYRDAVATDITIEDSE